MTLTLSMLLCPEQVPLESRTVAGGEFSIGRGPENDWVLPDPERYLSKRHCVVAFRAGGWQVSDLSTNGTYLNRDPEPIGAGAPRDLTDGDRLRLGAYEIEVRIEAAAGLTPHQRAADPFALDPFAATPSRGFEPDPLLPQDAQSDPFASALAPASINLPPEYDPLAPEPAETAFLGPTASDHSPHLEDAFRPPRVVLPEDWDRDLLAGIAPPPAALQRPQPPQPPAFAALPAALQPQPVAEPHPPPLAEAADASPIAAADGDLLRAFMRGAGIEDARPANPAEVMERLGAAFRATVSGLRQILIARSAIKSEFRIEQTVIRRSGNNPLKFSADDEDALAALFSTGRHTDMGAPAAIADALRDIRMHEVATVSAMQSAVSRLLAEFEPAKLRRQAPEGGFNFTSAQKKANAWDAFEKVHARISEALSDDFDSVFGKAFAQAYERAMAEIADEEPAR